MLLGSIVVKGHLFGLSDILCFLFVGRRSRSVHHEQVVPQPNLRIWRNCSADLAVPVGQEKLFTCSYLRLRGLGILRHDWLFSKLILLCLLFFC